MFKSINLLLVALLFIFSCKKEVEIVDVQYDYFPVKNGSWVLYDVDSIAYNDFTFTVDTFNFQVKEIIESTFIDNEGRETQRIERYYKENNDSIWFLKNVWTANRTAKRAEKVEHNVRYIKLIFPVKKNAKWDGNLANTSEEMRYEYKEIHSPYVLNSLSFDSCIVVEQENELNPFQHKFSEEVYAKYIGLIYKKHINLTKQANGVITSGYNYTYKAVSWGN